MKAILPLSILIFMVDLAQANDLRARYGLTIEDHDLARTVAPLVARPDRPIQMWDLSPQNEEACLAAIGNALEVYPTTFIKALIRKVVPAGDIYAWGHRVGGAQSPNMMVISCSRTVENSSYIEANVHDMIAAKVIDLAPPDWAGWKAVNRPGFKYGDLDAFKSELDNPDAWNTTRYLNQNGFVSRFGLVGEENDFQTYADQVFGHDADFASLVQQYPPMQRKLRILLDTYLALAPSLHTYFEQTGLTSAAATSTEATAEGHPKPDR